MYLCRTSGREPGRSASSRSRRGAIAALLGVSTLSTLFEMRALVAFDRTAGTNGPNPAVWPLASVLQRTTGRPELLVFVHQFCSCTAATINELARIPARQKQGSPAPAITLLYYRPVNENIPEFRNKALSLPGARTVVDNGGTEALLFGARTSGLVLLYRADGELLFRGGVTGSRGHEGDNYGLDQLISSLDSGRPARNASFVFGCSLGPQTLQPRGTRQ
jgi:hypothetical protein